MKLVLEIVRDVGSLLAAAVSAAAVVVVAMDHPLATALTALAGIVVGLVVWRLR